MVALQSISAATFTPGNCRAFACLVSPWRLVCPRDWHLLNRGYPRQAFWHTSGFRFEIQTWTTLSEGSAFRRRLACKSNWTIFVNSLDLKLAFIAYKGTTNVYRKLIQCSVGTIREAGHLSSSFVSTAGHLAAEVSQYQGISHLKKKYQCQGLARGRG